MKRRVLVVLVLSVAGAAFAHRSTAEPVSDLGLLRSMVGPHACTENVQLILTNEFSEDWAAYTKDCVVYLRPTVVGEHRRAVLAHEAAHIVASAAGETETHGPLMSDVRLDLCREFNIDPSL